MASTNEPQTASKPTKGSWSQTFGYVGAAVACLTVTGFAELFTRPPKIQEFGKVGQEFYSEFTDPTLASALEVYVFDDEEVRAREFKVGRKENGLWVIPSHHHYPADAEERLAKTASSVIGIKRGALVTRWNADHGHYGVINPKQDSLNVEDVEGVGQRLILRKDDDSVLADYIIGNEVEGQTGEYYVRHPQEDEVYIAKLDIDLSTKFTDWIEDKLFTFSNGDVVQLTINDYVFDERTVTESIVTNLSREEAWGDNWELDSLDPETQEINKEKINEALTALSNLEVVGVRPKQKGLTPELTLDREYLRMQAQLDLLQQDLMARGYALQPGKTNESFSLISREGELLAGTNEGLRYQLYFGSVFTGSQEELEIGFGDDGAKTDAATKQGTDAESSEAGTEVASGKPGRYLFVRVAFDDSLLDGPKSAPIEPEKSARLRELKAAEKEDGTTEVDEEQDDAAAEAEDGDDESEEPSEIEKLREEYEEAQQQYKTDLRDFESRQEKIKEGKEKAEEFNRRFAEWYYVIPGESFEKLELSRADLVKPKEQPETATDASASPTPGSPPPVTPFIPPADAEETVSDETADDETEFEEPAATDAESTEIQDATTDSDVAVPDENATDVDADVPDTTNDTE